MEGFNNLGSELTAWLRCLAVLAIEGDLSENTEKAARLTTCNQLCLFAYEILIELGLADSRQLTIFVKQGVVFIRCADKFGAS